MGPSLEVTMASLMALNLAKQTAAMKVTRWAKRTEPHLVIPRGKALENWSGLQKAKSLDWKMAYC